jgi:hypothetical protein
VDQCLSIFHSTCTAEDPWKIRRGPPQKSWIRKHTIENCNVNYWVNIDGLRGRESFQVQELECSVLSRLVSPSRDKLRLLAFVPFCTMLAKTM